MQHLGLSFCEAGMHELLRDQDVQTKSAALQKQSSQPLYLLLCLLTQLSYGFLGIQLQSHVQIKQ